MAVTARSLGKSSGVAGVAGSSKVYQDGDLLYLILESATRMQVFLRTQTEMFTDFVDREAGPLGLSVVINGIQYSISTGSATYRMGSDPRPASETSPDGLLIDSQRGIGGRSAPQMFYMTCGTGPGYGYACGQGDPPLSVTINPAVLAPLAGAAINSMQFGYNPLPGVVTAVLLANQPPQTVRTLSAVGGVGPLVINGLKYGDGNKYKAGASDSAPDTGQPPAADAPYLTQRNNNTYISLAKRGASTGKTVLAYSTAHRKLVVLIQPDGASSGIAVDDLRDKLADAGCDNAVFLDGSNSTCLKVGGRGWKPRRSTRTARTPSPSGSPCSRRKPTGDHPWALTRPTSSRPPASSPPR